MRTDRKRGTGFRMNLGSPSNRNYRPDAIAGSPDECAREIEGDTRDGGCSWGRSWAGRTGKYSDRNLSNRMAFEEEQRKILAVPTYQRSLAERGDNALVSSQAVSAMLRARALSLAELESWCDDA